MRKRGQDFPKSQRRENRVDERDRTMDERKEMGERNREEEKLLK